jgi:hypothetical protein
MINRINAVTFPLGPSLDMMLFNVFNVMLTLTSVVKIELCRELLVVLALPRFSCTAGFFLASLIIQL